MIQEYPLGKDIDPLGLYRKIRRRYRNTVLLESLEGPEKLATQSIICFSPKLVLEVARGRLWEGNVVLAKGLPEITQQLEDILRQYNPNGAESKTDQYRGGLLGFVSYDYVRYIEQISDHRKVTNYPDAMWGLYLDGIVFDHIRNRVIYFHHEDYTSRLDEIRAILETVDLPVGEISFRKIHYPVKSGDYENWVHIIQDNIRRGETFQTVISQRIEFEIKGDKFQLYEQLRRVNPSPYMYYLDFDRYTIIGSSPELLVSVIDQEVTTFPIAGTRPLGRTELEKQKMADELLSDEKERAEHNMLVDLARNDVGKISEIGSVKVEDYMSIEEFSHVIHLVSKVTGRLRANLSALDAFIAAFPAGTVSGAPKIRSMQIIDQLEPFARGPYAGSVGYFGIFNDCVQAITIRTAFGQYDQFIIQAGAGIVLDSDPSKEFEETLHKLGAFMQIIS